MQPKHLRHRPRLTAFDLINGLLLALCTFIFVYPFWYTLVGAFNDGHDYLRGGVYFWPRAFSLMNFRMVFADKFILSAFLITIWKVLVGTATALLVTSLAAYAITHPQLRFKRFYIPFMMFTMFFSGGLIPYFVLIVNLKLYDSFWVYILPGLFSCYNWIIIQSFMREMSPSIAESARIDGAGEYRIFFRLILPLSQPVLATIALFVAVGHWNSYFDSMMFTSSRHLMTIQYFLYKVITDASTATNLGASARASLPEQATRITPQSIKFATMVVTSLPILLVYPFLQRYFVSGLTIGAVKG